MTRWKNENNAAAAQSDSNCAAVLSIGLSNLANASSDEKQRVKPVLRHVTYKGRETLIVFFAIRTTATTEMTKKG